MTDSIFNNPQQLALEKFWEELNKKSEPIEVTFSSALAANQEIPAEQKFKEHELIEEERERIMRHSDRGAWED